jgi:(p)ppGpp synthase/HD superfamily hydrolase
MNSRSKEEQLIKNTPDDFRKQIELSLNFAREQFGEKRRPEGDRYFDHAINTALRIQKQGFDTATVIGGLLHHIQPSKENSKYIGDNISQEVGNILETYTKIDEVVKNTDASYDITTRYILNFVEDLRPIIIQIFNAQSNSHVFESIESDEERKELVKRNLNIHSNLAEYLGFDKVKTDITEEAFRITQKEDYEYIEKLYNKEDINQKKLKKYKEYIKDLLKDFKDDIKIESRVKSKYSTFNKLKKYVKEGYNDPINKIQDLIGFRIITQKKKDCFDILDAIWEKGEIVIEKYDDYISHPKPNGYKAMQGPVIFPEIDSMMIEIQILTQKMYEYNTYGPASHIAYKESKSRFAKPSDKYTWIKEVHQAIKNNKGKSSKEFSIPIEVEIFPNEIYVLTPKGRIIDLERGDTVTDFAYRIHTDIGNSMIGAKVNGKSVSFDYKLETGDKAEIIVQKGRKHPKPNLLSCANSPGTKAKIERAIK